MDVMDRINKIVGTYEYRKERQGQWGVLTKLMDELQSEFKNLQIEDWGIYDDNYKQTYIYNVDSEKVFTIHYAGIPEHISHIQVHKEVVAEMFSHLNL